MRKINFVFAIHFHQPVGQLKIDRVQERCYSLLLRVFKEFSELKFTVHINGPLLLQMIEYYPEWISEI